MKRVVGVLRTRFEDGNVGHEKEDRASVYICYYDNDGLSDHEPFGYQAYRDG